MNIEDNEEQEDMEISEKVDDTTYNIYREWWKTYTKKETWLIFNLCETIVYVLYVPNVYQQPQIYLDHDFNCFKCSA